MAIAGWLNNVQRLELRSVHGSKSAVLNTSFMLFSNIGVGLDIIVSGI
jgi:hypothetical protein